MSAADGSIAALTKAIVGRLAEAVVRRRGPALDFGRRRDGGALLTHLALMHRLQNALPRPLPAVRRQTPLAQTEPASETLDWSSTSPHGLVLPPALPPLLRAASAAQPTPWTGSAGVPMPAGLPSNPVSRAASAVGAAAIERTMSVGETLVAAMLPLGRRAADAAGLASHSGSRGISDDAGVFPPAGNRELLQQRVPVGAFRLQATLPGDLAAGGSGLELGEGGTDAGQTAPVAGMSSMPLPVRRVPIPDAVLLVQGLAASGSKFPAFPQTLAARPPLPGWAGGAPRTAREGLDPGSGPCASEARDGGLPDQGILAAARVAATSASAAIPSRSAAPGGWSGQAAAREAVGPPALPMPSSGGDGPWAPAVSGVAPEAGAQAIGAIAGRIDGSAEPAGATSGAHHMVVGVNGTVGLDEHRLARRVSDHQVRQAQLPAAGQTRATPRSAAVFSGTRIPQ